MTHIAVEFRQTMVGQSNFGFRATTLQRQLLSMFISPALEELTETESASDRSQPRAVPSSVHDPPSVEGEFPDSTKRMTAKGSGSSSDYESFQRDLARQLVGVDQQTFQKVKQAVQSALTSQGGSADPSSVIQVTYQSDLDLTRLWPWPEFALLISMTATNG